MPASAPQPKTDINAQILKQVLSRLSNGHSLDCDIEQEFDDDGDVTILTFHGETTPWRISSKDGVISINTNTHIITVRGSNFDFNGNKMNIDNQIFTKDDDRIISIGALNPHTSEPVSLSPAIPKAFVTSIDTTDNHPAEPVIEEAVSASVSSAAIEDSAHSEEAELQKKMSAIADTTHPSPVQIARPRRSESVLKFSPPAVKYEGSSPSISSNTDSVVEQKKHGNASLDTIELDEPSSIDTTDTHQPELVIKQAVSASIANAAAVSDDRSDSVPVVNLTQSSSNEQKIKELEQRYPEQEKAQKKSQVTLASSASESLKTLQQSIPKKLDQNPRYPQTFKAAVTEMAQLIVKLQQQGELSSTDAMSLMKETNELIDTPQNYAKFLVTARSYEAVAGGKLSAYMTLIAGWAAKIVTGGYKGDRWIRLATEKLQQIKTVEILASESESLSKKPGQ